MRTDIFDFIRTIIMNGIKPNYSKIARQFNCDSRIVAHFQTCFMSLLLLRGIEYKLNISNKDIIRFPNQNIQLMKF